MNKEMKPFWVMVSEEIKRGDGGGFIKRVREDWQPRIVFGASAEDIKMDVAADLGQDWDGDTMEILIAPFM